MGGGVIIGVFWGVLLSLLVAGVVSLNTPLPAREGDIAELPQAAVDADSADTPGEELGSGEAGTGEAGTGEAGTGDAGTGGDTAAPAETAPADTIPLPAGSEFNRPPPEEDALLPQPDTAPGGQSPGAPPLPLPTTSQGIDTAPAPQPEISAPPVAPQPAEPDTGALDLPGIGGQAPSQPAALRPATVPAPEPDTAAAPDAAPAPRPPRGSGAGAQADAGDAAAEEAAPSAAVAEAAPEVATTVATSRAADTTEAAAPAPSAATVVQLIPPRDGATPSLMQSDGLPTVATDIQPARPRVMRPASGAAAEGARALPQIVVPGRTATAQPSDATPEAAPNDTASSGADDPSPDARATRVPALAAYAAPFDATETRALIAVVLIDEPGARLDLETLTGFSFPVAFAIDPLHPQAAERAAAYRAAGFEVVLLGSVIPGGATAADTEVALQAARLRVPEAVALMDTPDNRIQSDRAVLEATVGAAAGEGQGLLAFPRGLNTAEQMAARQDVPAATVFRLLDDAEQSAPVITRYLGRAEFAAVQEGVAVVAGRTRPDTVTALYSWALGNRNEGVAIAPVSAVLRRIAEQP
ncbi:divergent polysaccharide deacetylase family protein [Roseibacterium sp. SDUM158017]|uniref:divergent polysaccharide deacetylase family protein n=1 Tax=Roseicyclus salinarum TaxID=3036773 RepID=UPI002414D27B|nr:divergent polysaccharide deacetylase family protein [Roseibacterium sp. SDUM158017]MDG4647559.1 divergent polysaccharide deacetylase family protein [Roseibacterium sp. SDUM158017]